jgi:hypothetical protein
MAVVLNEYGGTVGVCSCDTNYLFFMIKCSSVLVTNAKFSFHPTRLVA